MNIPAPPSINQHEYIQRSFTSRYNVAEGGVRGGKNITNALAFCLALEDHPDKIHLVGGYDVGAAETAIIEANGYGVENYFYGRCRRGKHNSNPALFVKTVTGEKIIIIAGLGNSKSADNIAGMSAGMVYITEVNRCHPDAVEMAVQRLLASSSPKFFFDLNPKPEGHWFYTNILNVWEQKQAENPNFGLNYGHFNIFDNMSLTQEQVLSALEGYDKASARYRRDILGKRIALEGLVYPMFNKDFHVVPNIARPYEKFWISVDPGTYNAFVAQLWGLANGVYYLIDEFYHSGRYENFLKTAVEYDKELIKLAGGRKIESVIIDPEDAGFVAQVRKSKRFFVRKAKKDVLAGINDVSEALRTGLVKICANCTHTIKEMGMYRWNEKSVDSDKPIKEDDHCMDAMRYFVFTQKILRQANKSKLWGRDLS